MYGDLAPWFHLLTPPSDYVEDAALVMSQLRASVTGPLRTLLELGAGGGNTASHLSQELQLTLTDPSPDMLALSRTINPDAEHIGALGYADAIRMAADGCDLVQLNALETARELNVRLLIRAMDQGLTTTVS